MDLQGMDTLVAAAIGALAAIFVFAFVTLVFICKRQNKRKNWDRLENCSTNRKSKKKHPEGKKDFAMALGDIGVGSALEQILNDEQWVDDATGLIPHCLAILRTCHSLTERLVANLAIKSPGIKNPANLRLIQAAKRIPSRVDDIAQAMYPPLDVRLLEARSASLVLAVQSLALLSQTTFTNKNELIWIDQSIELMDTHLLVLRKAALEIDISQRSEFVKHNSYV